MKIRKMNFSFLAVMMVAFTVMFTSCKKEDDPKPQKETDELTGSITGNKMLDPNVSYKLTGPLVVESGAELNIPAGTVIKAAKGFNSYILVLQGGKININGTAEKPVTMTADIPNAGAGHWGGLIINGYAPLAGGTTGSTEISSAHLYGGNNPTDNSGSIRYLILEYTGARSAADVEHNGLTLNGVGNGTTIENVYILHSSDDGIELFGGTVNVKNLLVVNPDDDMFDFTQGYTGTLENAYGIWEAGHTSTESDPRGIEADGNLDGNFPTQSGQSNITVRNITFDIRIAPAADSDIANVSNKMQDVIKVRRSALLNVSNAVVKGTGTVIDLIDMKDGKGNANVNSTISLSNALSNSILGSEVNPPTGFPGAAVQYGNTGCAKDVFSWTKYSFKE
ncbi:MAG TPA: hypothetical protein PL173_06670 [Saprospiraceae bacterium]|nr:hypothetical protein [Saprospiraceae bacterium]HMZ73311.1 hypothetical protein [Saprospiraceae bacterium]HNE65537.1 hypothetical protein [Saprospiraceae bacterium]HNG12747.1 hypothetical protein [Saprospiraceae bacterium]HNJ16926.1 hypothetical protein [Saprospiraceae bacterium]